ncbi:MAG: pyridoxamine kinase [Butyrivibrio sp.]|nr:pyridoxamine kinase [Butyrivibrio sp.]
MNMTNHNKQKKIAVINDYTGFGRCSLAVAMPIISQLRIQCCPVPTSIFSDHTGFESYFFDDYTDKMQAYIDEWAKLGLRFNGILTGFLGSAGQIETVRRFIEDFGDGDTKVIIDPVMGDNGKPYPTYTSDMCERMKELVCHADILTPNLTEACILTDTPYTPESFTAADYRTLSRKLLDTGAEKIVISGISMGSFIANAICERGKEPLLLKQKRIGHERSGTGDVFSAIIAAESVRGTDFVQSVRKASEFVKKCIRVTEEFDIPPTDGVCFEEVLHELK